MTLFIEEKCVGEPEKLMQGHSATAMASQFHAAIEVAAQKASGCMDQQLTSTNTGLK